MERLQPFHWGGGIMSERPCALRSDSTVFRSSRISKRLLNPLHCSVRSTEAEYCCTVQLIPVSSDSCNCVARIRLYSPADAFQAPGWANAVKLFEGPEGQTDTMQFLLLCRSYQSVIMSVQGVAVETPCQCNILSVWPYILRSSAVQLGSKPICLYNVCSKILHDCKPALMQWTCQIASMMYRPHACNVRNAIRFYRTHKAPCQLWVIHTPLLRCMSPRAMVEVLGTGLLLQHCLQSGALDSRSMSILKYLTTSSMIVCLRQQTMVVTDQSYIEWQDSIDGCNWWLLLDQVHELQWRTILSYFGIFHYCRQLTKKRECGMADAISYNAQYKAILCTCRSHQRVHS